MLNLATGSDTPPPPGGVPRRALERLDGRALRVLIAEDEGLVALDLASIVEQLGGEAVGVVVTASEAVAQAGLLSPDVVLMDIRLARGDGIEAAHEIRVRFGTPAVFVTGNTDAETMRRLRVHSDAPVVRKPIVIGDLRDAILKVCPP